MFDSDIHHDLDRFFAWSRVEDPSDLDYPHCTPVRRLLGSGIGAEPLSDEEAGQVDRALCLLKAEDPEGYRLILRVHRDCRTLRQLEAKGEGERKRNARVLSSAHAFLRGVMRGACELVG
jgi:hypothetical protein